MADRRVVERAFPFLRLLTAGLCAYESAAILTRKAPTLSELRGRHAWLAPALIGALAFHLYWEPT